MMAQASYIPNSSSLYRVEYVVPLPVGVPTLDFNTETTHVAVLPFSHPIREDDPKGAPFMRCTKIVKAKNEAEALQLHDHAAPLSATRNGNSVDIQSRVGQNADATEIRVMLAPDVAYRLNFKYSNPGYRFVVGALMADIMADVPGCYLKCKGTKGGVIARSLLRFASLEDMKNTHLRLKSTGIALTNCSGDVTIDQQKSPGYPHHIVNISRFSGQLDIQAVSAVLIKDLLVVGDSRVESDDMVAVSKILNSSLGLNIRSDRSLILDDDRLDPAFDYMVNSVAKTYTGVLGGRASLPESELALASNMSYVSLYRE